MRDSVARAFHGFSADLEGVVPFLYLDIKGLVTTAMGVLVDPMPMVDALPLCRPDGSPASIAEKRAEWARVHARQDLRLRGGMVYRAVAQLHLTPEGVEAVTESRLRLTVAHLRRYYPDWDQWPADAQLGTLSMAWACGAAFGTAGGWPKLHAALLARRWDDAAEECTIRGGGTIPLRNRRTRLCYRNARQVELWGLDPDVLHWPEEAAPPSIPVEIVDDYETSPETPEAKRSGPGSPGYEATSDAVHEAAKRHLERERE